MGRIFGSSFNVGKKNLVAMSPTQPQVSKLTSNANGNQIEVRSSALGTELPILFSYS